jgi:hypothetical protein
MLRRETDAGFKESGWLAKRYYFQAGPVATVEPLGRRDYRDLIVAQADDPVCVMSDERGGKRWWMFRDVFYSENEGLEAIEVKALVLEREAKRRRRLDRAVAFLEQNALPAAPTRSPIPDDVRAFVWNRDGGRCVSCGANQRLEFDHIIPVALGGANTARNLQLLCEPCNRAKGAAIA